MAPKSSAKSSEKTKTAEQKGSEKIARSTGGRRRPTKPRVTASTEKRAIIIPDTPLYEIAGGSKASRSIKPTTFFGTVPRPVVVKDGKVVKDGAIPVELGDVGLRGALTPCMSHAVVAYLLHS